MELEWDKRANGTKEPSGVSRSAGPNCWPRSGAEVMAACNFASHGYTYIYMCATEWQHIYVCHGVATLQATDYASFEADLALVIALVIALVWCAVIILVPELVQEPNIIHGLGLRLRHRLGLHGR